jgi:hypothetical protein
LARPVFSEELYSLPFGSTGGFNSPAVAAGFRWIVRDIVVLWSAAAWMAPGQIQLLDNENSVLFWSDVDAGGGSELLHWEGRQVLDEGDQINVSITNPGASLRVSGYILSL